MPKIIAHALAGATIVSAICPSQRLDKWVVLAGAIIAVSPDFDFALEWLFANQDIHRGFTHSLLFSFLIGLTFYLWLGPENQLLALGFSLAYLSHTLLDLSTSTAGGVKLFYPFSNKYYHLGLTGIFENPFGVNFSQALRWILIETVIFLPLFILTIILKKNKI